MSKGISAPPAHRPNALPSGGSIGRTATMTPNVKIARLQSRLRYYADDIERVVNALASGAASTDVADQLRRCAEAMRRSAD